MKYLKKQQYFSVTCSQDCHTWDMNFVNFPWNFWCAWQAIDRAIRYLTHDDTQCHLKGKCLAKTFIYLHVSGYFWIRNFSLADSSPTRIRCNPQLSVFALQSENVEYAMKSGYFFIQWCHKIEPSSLQWIFKAVPCAMLWLLYFLDLNFKCATSWQTESESAYV